MNISVLASIISNENKVKGGDLFYIGAGIGLSGGLLCAIIIAHYKYIKLKLKNKPPISDLSNDKDDTTIINAIITGRHIQVV